MFPVLSSDNEGINSNAKDIRDIRNYKLKHLGHNVIIWNITM
jgi:hypothetical protein